MKSLVEYRDLIDRAQALADRHPAGYRVRVALLALLGFAYVVVVFVGSLLLGIGAVIAMFAAKSAVLIKVAWIPIVFAYLILKSLWVRLPPPEGRRVTRAEAPQLFGEIDHVRSALHSQRVHEVVLTHEFNAAVAQVPRLGILGWQKNCLVLGVPRLAALSPVEFRAVLAHEFGHLSKDHARFGNWIYRMRQTWGQLIGALQARGSRATRLFTTFLSWYGPYFNAYTFVLARGNEYEADRESARVAGAENAARALTAVHAKGEYLEDGFWPSFYAPAARTPVPPERPYSQYLGSLRAVGAEAARGAIAAALRRQTTLHNTHPSLTDRLKALGQGTPSLRAFDQSAAEAFLGDLYDELQRSGDAGWTEALAPRWKEHHESLAGSAATIDRVRAAPPEQVTADEWFEFAVALERIEGSEAALPALEQLLARSPGHAGARFMRGRIRIANNDDSGIDDVEYVMKADPQAEEPGAELLYQLFYGRNEIGRAQPYLDVLNRHAEKRAAARQERGTVGPKDEFDPHGLPAEALAPYVEALRATKKVKRAWLARKRVVHYPESPCFVVIVQFRTFTNVTRKLLQEIVKALPDAHAHLLLNHSHHKAQWKKIAAISGSEMRIED